MTDIFSFITNSNEKSIQDMFSEYQKSKNKNTDITASLTQGDKFMNYQSKIKKKVTNSQKYQQLFSNKEGFTQNNQEDLNLTSSTNSVLDNTQMTSSDQSSLNNLKKEYKVTLAEYNKLQEKINRTTGQYLARSNPSTNSYAGKHIALGENGPLFYVTKQGVAKLYRDSTIRDNTAGKNGCPAFPDGVITLNIPFNNAYAKPGATIPTNPPLITGSPMVNGQSCGYEGDNVYVNLPVSSSQLKNPTYVGTYMNNVTTPMTFIGGDPGTTITVQNPNFDEPQIANDSYEYINDSSTVPGWTFVNGCLINNSSAWGFPTPYPYGSQACSVQSENSISQTFTNVEPGTYTLNLQACGRNCCDGSGLSNQINIQLNGTTFYTINIGVNVWTPISTSFTITQQGTNTITFIGTDATSDRSTAIQGIEITLSGASSGGTYSFDMCKMQAALSGNQYFAIQDADASGNGYCAVTNDYINATQPGTSYKTASQTALWSTSTASSQVSSPGAYAKLTSLGTLQVYNSSGQSIYSTPGPSNGNYWGCYGDTETRAIPDMVGSGDTTYSDCLTSPSSTQTNSVFGVQYPLIRVAMQVNALLIMKTTVILLQHDNMV
jgi:hypothetical protein